MLPKDHEKIIRDVVANLTDTGKVTALLQQLRDSNDTEHSAFESLTTDHSKATEQINTLKENNMNLFLKVGHTSATPEPPKDETFKTLDEIVAGIK